MLGWFTTVADLNCSASCHGAAFQELLKHLERDFATQLVHTSARLRTEDHTGGWSWTPGQVHRWWGLLLRLGNCW